MENDVFKSPVSVIVGLGYVRNVETVMDACMLLNEWGSCHGRPEHTMALKVCRAAIAGEIDAETARGTFVAFARRHHLLATSEDGLIAATALGALSQPPQGSSQLS